MASFPPSSLSPPPPNQIATAVDIVDRQTLQAGEIPEESQIVVLVFYTGVTKKTKRVCAEGTPRTKNLSPVAHRPARLQS